MKRLAELIRPRRRFRYPVKADGEPILPEELGEY
jgi:hypothetical protein